MADRIEWDHGALESALDALMPECLAAAQRVKAAADSMRDRPGIAEFSVSEHHGPARGYRYAGGRRYAAVSADAPSTRAFQARTNALNKAAGSC